VKPEGSEVDCPSGLVTVIATVPELAGGDMASISVELVTVTAVEFEAPNATEAPAWKPVPVMVTTVPPEVGPAVGEAPETATGVELLELVEVLELLEVVELVEVLEVAELVM
jgi:hypothetical protein